MKRLKIQFPGEEGIDYGGLTREWLALLNKSVFNPDFGLFQTSANGRNTILENYFGLDPFFKASWLKPT